jgi:hypothetical protein
MILLGLSKGIEYKNNNTILTFIINSKDTIITHLQDKNDALLKLLSEKPTEVYKHNWTITLIISTLSNLLFFATYLLIK